MQPSPTQLTFTVDLEPGEKLSLPQEVVESIGPGHWIITIRPLEPGDAQPLSRGHSAFLNSYAPDDEGLYDDCSAR